MDVFLHSALLLYSSSFAHLHPLIQSLFLHLNALNLTFRHLLTLMNTSESNVGLSILPKDT